MKYLLVLLLINNSIIYSQELEKREEKEIVSQIKGTVLDYDSSPLIEAKIKIKSLEFTTSTNSEGNFVLKDIKNFPIIIEVSKTGYQDTEVVLESHQPFVTIKLNVIERHLEAVVVTSRRKNEEVQKIPIPIAVLGGKKVEEAGAFNVNRVKELVPSVQLYSSNPRNTTLNIRGLGSTFGLTNDGIEPGVGFYVDGVYYARPAATALDFVDLDRIEVLRGPQGTLFGKNTTAGTFNIFTKRPIFSTSNTVEVSYGNYGYIQAKLSLNGKLFDKIAGRLSFSGTQRDGVVENVRSEQKINDLNNLSFRSQLLYKPTDNLEIVLSGDYNRQRPNGYAQVIAGVVKTKRAEYRQFDQIIKDLGYILPSLNPFDRKVDNDVSWRSNNDLGGVSLNIDGKLGNGKITSTTAWRFWDWDPSNDRDFTGLSALKKSQAPSYHTQLSQEIRYSGEVIKDKLSLVSGIFGITQNLETRPFHYEESGKDQWRFSQSTTSTLWQTPGLFDGYGIKTYYDLKNKSLAWFNQLDWVLVSKIHLLVGLRYNYDEKSAIYDRITYGGLQTSDPALLALKKIVYTDQSFDVSVSDRNFSGQLTANYNVNENFITFATYSKSYKPIGVNIGGLPTDNGRVMTELATVKPEAVDHFELGLKSSFTKAQFNLTWFNTIIKDYQTLVQSPELGVNRGYLANAEKVQVQGVEIESNVKVTEYLNFTSSISYTDGKYITFTNAPLPLEETGASVSFKDVSGGRLPGISKWSGSIGVDVNKKSRLFGFEGAVIAGVNTYFRSNFSSSPSPSQYLNIDGYALFNGRLGFKTSNGTIISLWGKNIFNKNYFEQLLPAAGNAGHYAGVLGDPITFGLTVKFTIK